MTPHQQRALDELCTTVRMVFDAGTVSEHEIRLRAFVHEWVPERRPLPELAADANTIADAVLAEREACIREIEHWACTPRPNDEVFPDALVASIRAGEHRDPTEDPVPQTPPARAQATAEDHAIAIAEEIDTLICARVDRWDDAMRAGAKSKLAEVLTRAIAWPLVRACARDDVLRAMICEHEQRTVDRADLVKALRDVAEGGC